MRPSGLCDACRHRRLIVSGKGSRFVLCERSRTDGQYARYPALPVLRCAGFEARGDDGEGA
ncbi:MAG: hypothetical protein FJ207_15180 [Gemmatimonadetes bacterium]|nr:hypothetical protein [Gemmatimonadota bacterium]